MSAGAYERNPAALFRLAIYVNAGTDRLQKMSKGAKSSLPITENKRWSKGEKLFLEAQRRGEELPLVFAQYAELTFWAVAREIALKENSTQYRFANLLPLRGRRRSDLVVDSTGSQLPDDFIRSYALVRTPPFLTDYIKADDGSEDQEMPADLIGLEGELQLRMIKHRRREEKLRTAKIADAINRGNGRLACEVPGCGFDFASAYGDLGEGYAQVHHLRPLAEYARREETRLEDLAIVCANCHAMIHRGGECRPLDALCCSRIGRRRAVMGRQR
jgi:hypothetical protein